MNKKYIYFLLATFIFIVDRVTKIAALMWLADSRYVVNSCVSFELTFNRGISWGIFHSAPEIIFFIISLLIAGITAVVFVDAYYSYKYRKPIVGHVCIIAGSVANLIDRMVYGGVIDFIILSYKQYSWPVFNIADIAIVCGVFLLIVCDEK